MHVDDVAPRRTVRTVPDGRRSREIRSRDDAPGVPCPALAWRAMNIGVAISPGHALSLVDGVGVVPLVAGSLWLHVGLWRRRSALARWAQSRPATGIGLAFAAGLGLGLLLASAFSAFYWLWALGAAIFV